MIAPTSGGGLDLRRLLVTARRHWVMITLIPLVFLLADCVYTVLAPPVYLAKAQLLLDTRKLQLFENQALVSDPSLEAAAVESQMEVVRSESVASSVVEDLNLASDPEFLGVPTTTAGRALAAGVRLLGRGVSDRILGTPPTSVEERTRAAVGYFRANLQIQRLRTTYVIEVGFTSGDPVKASRIANAVADAYVLDQTQSKQYTTRRAMNWLQERMAELRDQAVNAEKAVQDFRTKNNLVKIGSSTMTDQQLLDVNAQLARAREARSEAKLRYDRLQVIMKSRVPDAAMAAWLQNDVINRLRQSYVEASRRQSEYAVRLGPDHQATLSAGKELRQIEQSASNELARIASGYKSDIDGAEVRERELVQRLAVETDQNSAARGQQGALDLLVTSAKNYETLYNTFSQRYLEAAQQQNFVATEARTITPAGPGLKISPNPRQNLPLALAFGLMVGCGAAFLRDRADRSLRTLSDFETTLGINCLGIIPAVEHRPQDHPQALRGRAESAEDRVHSVLSHVLVEPFSRFAETVRNMKVVVDTSTTEMKIVGFVSAVPGEGKSTIAANFAQLIASVGRRTLLVDADLRKPSLTRALASNAKSGLLEVLAGRETLERAVVKDPTTGLEFLPSVLRGGTHNTAEILASSAMSNFLATARKAYDYIVMDFSPLAPVVDAKASSHLVDGYVFVVEWGRTSPAVVVEALGSAEIIHNRVIGGVLNKADVRALGHLEAYKGAKYHGYYHG